MRGAPPARRHGSPPGTGAGAGASEVFAHFHHDGAALDIYDAINLRMEDGAIVTIASTGATSRTLRTYEVRIFGTEGMLYMELWRGAMEHIRMSGERRQFPDLAADEIYPHQAPARNLIALSSIPPATARRRSSAWRPWK